MKNPNPTLPIVISVSLRFRSTIHLNPTVTFPAEIQQSTSRAEAERLLGITEKLLQSRDLNGCRDFAILAQETEPLLDGSDQILAVVDVLIAAEKRTNTQPDWYAVLQLDRRYDDIDSTDSAFKLLILLKLDVSNHSLDSLAVSLQLVSLIPSMIEMFDDDDDLIWGKKLFFNNGS